MKIRSLLCLLTAVCVTACAPPGGGGGIPGSEALIGVWILSDVIAGEGPDYQAISFRSDGSWVCGQIIDSNSITQAGTWSINAGGCTLVVYQNDNEMSSSPMTFTGGLSAGATTLTVSGTVNGSPMQVVFTKAAAPGSDPIAGLWLLSSSPGNVTAQVISIAADGSWVSGQIRRTEGFESTAIAGTWVNAGSSYTITAYQAQEVGLPPMEVPGTLSSGNAILTVEAPDGDYVFTRQSSPPTDPGVGLWVISAINNHPSYGYPIAGMLSAFADGGWVSSQIQDEGDEYYASSTTVGTWEPTGGDDYTISVYQTDGSEEFPFDLLGTLSDNGATFTIFVPQGANPTMEIVYSKL